jgi:hypothetical protein
MSLIDELIDLADNQCTFYDFMDDKINKIKFMEYDCSVKNLLMKRVFADESGCETVFYCYNKSGGDETLIDEITTNITTKFTNTSGEITARSTIGTRIKLQERKTAYKANCIDEIIINYLKDKHNEFLNLKPEVLFAIMMIVCSYLTMEVNTYEIISSLANPFSIV